IRRRFSIGEDSLSETVAAAEKTHAVLPADVPKDQPSWALMSTCVHCGLCLNHCPTYKTLRMEMDSPRGRIYQVLQVMDGNLEVGESFTKHIDRCLGCLACETACPSGVQYGKIVERARAQIENQYRRPFFVRTVRGFMYGKVLRNFGLLRFMARSMRLYQRSGAQTLLRKSGVLKLMGLADMDRLAPRIDSEFFFSEIGKVFPAVGEKRGKIAFLAGCINNVAFSHLNTATVKVLTQNGIEVHIPQGQGCCGALHAHAGFRDAARELARNNINVFLGGDFDAIVTNAAGCGSTLKEYNDLLEHDPQFVARAGQFVAKVKDITEYLAQVGLREVKTKLNRKVAYQDACHLAHAQKVRAAPRELLKSIGCEVVELPHADQCCGSAGVYNVAQNELSMRILEAKMDDVSAVASSAQMLVTANVGCLIQLRAGLDKRKMQMPVRHIVELLDEAYS
ncbi:MAG TPA: heterodisulfide reductase-related iron-sulfur binding cluster, partial [Alphaproteobacteria bacterium]|nr:heterodisulfide reductase-related iron-sulfur binding cluster [Alphaproteobacteria bacterium]